jgi:hypothetical protein
MRPVVLIESPYSGGGTEAVRYLACCLLDSVLRGEAPIASHAIYPLCLPENCGDFGGKTGREVGLECRDALAATYHHTFGELTHRWIYTPTVCIRYIDIGVSLSGEMQRPGRYEPDRNIQGEALRIWQSGEWPTKTRWSSTNE